MAFIERAGVCREEKRWVLRGGERVEERREEERGREWLLKVEREKIRGEKEGEGSVHEMRGEGEN